MSQGKYQGKRLSATEVTRLYAAGERDFCGAVLRGCNFRGADLSGADFSGADIRSSDFTHAVLIKANFAKAMCGVQKRWFLAKIVLTIWFLALFSAVSRAVKIVYLESFVNPEYIIQNAELTNYLIFVANVIIYLILVAKVISVRPAVCISLVGLISGLMLIDYLGASHSFGVLAMLGIVFAFTSAFFFPSTLATPNALMPFVIIATSVVIVAVASILTVGMLQALLFVRYSPSKDVFLGWGEDLGWAAFVLAPLLLFVFISVWRESKSFTWIVKTLKLFSVTSGTAFCGSNLSSANFTLADLKRASFSDWGNGSANMLHVRFKNARGLDSQYRDKSCNA